MQDETALYGAKMMQPGLTTADNEENSLRPATVICPPRCLLNKL